MQSSNRQLYIGPAPAKKWITHATLKSVQAMLPDHFIQPHKSWLVNSEHITAVKGNIIYCGAQQIPVSKYQKKKYSKNF